LTRRGGSGLANKPIRPSRAKPIGFGVWWKNYFLHKIESNNTLVLVIMKKYNTIQKI
jgi:hypothetical protein